MNPLPAAFWVALGAGVAYLGVVAAGLRGPVRAIKPIPALALGWMLAPISPLAASGMVASAAGDAFLLDKNRFLLPGVGAFLVGHVLFVPAFLQLSGGTPSVPYVALLGVFAIGMLAAVRPKKGVLKVAIPIYAAALCAMVAAAGTLGPIGTVGGIAFLISDATLSIRLFRRDFPGGDLLVMITYYGALLLLAAAVGSPP